MQSSKHRVVSRSQSGPLQAAVDSFVWAGAVLLALLLRFDFMVDNSELDGLVILVPAAVIVATLCGLAFGLYTGRSRSDGLGEITAVVKSVALTTLALTVLNQMFDPLLVPLAVPFLAGIVALLGTAGARYRRIARRSPIDDSRRDPGVGAALR